MTKNLPRIPIPQQAGVERHYNIQIYSAYMIKNLTIYSTNKFNNILKFALFFFFFF